MLQVRDFCRDDFDEVQHVWALTGMGGAQRGDTFAIIEQSVAMGGKLLVVEIEGKVIATSWMTFDGRRIHLHHFGVHPDYQRQGIGLALVKQSLLFAKQKGYQIKLEVHKDNQKAINLYTKLGFTYLGDYDVYIIRRIKDLE
ncbi:MAG: GNAT family N-acetyltransferase [Bacteroidales bacterium]|nr:GNAT family N-acetyltransferase [Bacteroidales bacterium]MBN2748577.1 GNAT family N-acetyltransferase [Bacteroidales bacterium]